MIEGADLFFEAIHSSSSVTSPTMRLHSQSSSSRDNPSPSRSTRTNFPIPCASSQREQAAPMPEAAPVTIAVLPKNVIELSLQRGIGGHSVSEPLARYAAEWANPGYPMF